MASRIGGGILVYAKAMFRSGSAKQATPHPSTATPTSFAGTSVYSLTDLRTALLHRMIDARVELGRPPVMLR